MTSPNWTRRQAVTTGAALALAGGLAACGNDTTPPGGSAGTGGPSSDPTPTPSPSRTDEGPTALADVADVPVGGGVSATGGDGKPVIVTQPTEGTFVAFSAICTHQGCTVAPVDDILRCPCHFSTYDLATGEVTDGPAPSPLPEVAVRVVDDQVVEA
ncbi:MAG: Rieske (2Fe-2S) protein [Nocardioides sp.]|nr:Rieske (2Fe-2S) protein [Nocardioides sp.]